MTDWRDVVDRAAAAIGPISPTLLRHWHNEMDDVEQRVLYLDDSSVDTQNTSAAGLHALVVLGVARLGETWQPRQLVDVAAAVELAYRASHQHRRVVNGVGSHLPAASGVRLNTQAVLDGDRSITQAAVLVAEVGPEAYRLLVRGYGATQVGQLCDAPAPTALVEAAVGLGALVAGVSAADIDRLWSEVESPSEIRSTPAAVLAWARGRSAGRRPRVKPLAGRRPLPSAPSKGFGGLSRGSPTYRNRGSESLREDALDTSARADEPKSVSPEGLGYLGTRR